jgi:hypothetical protein
MRHLDVDAHPAPFGVLRNSVVRLYPAMGANYHEAEAVHPVVIAQIPHMKGTLKSAGQYAP